MTGLYIFIALIAIALLGWAVAELKNRCITFEHSEAEKEEASCSITSKKSENSENKTSKTSWNTTAPRAIKLSEKAEFVCKAHLSC